MFSLMIAGMISGKGCTKNLTPCCFIGDVVLVSWFSAITLMDSSNNSTVGVKYFKLSNPIATLPKSQTVRS